MEKSIVMRIYFGFFESMSISLRISPKLSIDSLSFIPRSKIVTDCFILFS
ncbi:Uncharacterised protein [Vibrio cholerae]|nr:Uncharacterised protein [Vibrio cholerae]